MKRILVCDGLHETGLELLRTQKDIEVEAPNNWSMEQIAAELPNYEAMVVRSRTKVTPDMLEGASRMMVIGRAGTGVDNIDIETASAKGILVMNTPGANAMAAAEHTMALILSLARHVPQATQSIREGRWEKARFVGTELYQQTLGILGLGKIGSIVADRALAMGMEVICHDPFISKEVATGMGVSWVDLDELIARSDFITLHTPQTPETEHIINAETIGRMRKGVRIINCARGKLVDESALYEALAGGHVAGAALDVFANEPPADSPLVTLPNVVLTPHLGASSVQAQANVAHMIASQLIAYFARGVIKNAVNFPSISSKLYERLHPYLILAEKLGSLQGQLCSSIEHLEIQFSGPDLEELPLEPITQTVIKGLLEPVLAEKVNLVNAPILLKERQVDLVTSTTSEPKGYMGMITVRASGEKGLSSASGTVFPGEGPRLIRLDNYRLEAELEGINLVVQNLDRPGVIGLIGQTLGQFEVNIANMHLSRTKEKDKAIAIIRVDEEAPNEAIDLLREHESILSATQIRL